MDCTLLNGSTDPVGCCKAIRSQIQLLSALVNALHQGPFPLTQLLKD